MSIITSTQGKATTLARVQALMAGTEKYFPNGSFTLGNTTYTTASLVQALKSLEDALNAVDAAHSSTKDAVIAMRATETKMAPLMRDYRSFVRATFSTASAHSLTSASRPPRRESRSTASSAQPPRRR